MPACVDDVGAGIWVGPVSLHLTWMRALNIRHNVIYIEVRFRPYEVEVKGALVHLQHIEGDVWLRNLAPERRPRQKNLERLELSFRFRKDSALQLELIQPVDETWGWDVAVGDRLESKAPGDGGKVYSILEPWCSDLLDVEDMLEWPSNTEGRDSDTEAQSSSMSFKFNLRTYQHWSSSRRAPGIAQRKRRNATRK
jgi:hypothetical protein